MLSRRLLASACALCLLVPAAATAMPPHDPPAAYGGPTVAGDTKSDLNAGQSYADKVGSLPPEELAAAYGTTKIDAKPVAPSRGPIISNDDGTNGWRIAAVVEAGVLAAFAAGAAFLVAGRQRRAPRMGM
jgi:hypothetical protein